MKIIALFFLFVIIIGPLSFFFYPVIKAEYNLYLLNNNNFKLQILTEFKKERKLTPLDNQFGVVINKIVANARVVDFADYNNIPSLEYILSSGLVHQPDSVYPGQTGNMVIIAQVPGSWFKYTRSNTEFYLMYHLLPNDIIQVFYKGQEFDYLVTDKFKINENRLKDFTRASDQKLLTILSGWPPGTVFNRLVIQAKIIE